MKINKKTITSAIITGIVAAGMMAQGICSVSALPDNVRAAGYAARYYKNYNSNYIRLTNDCCNFVSQCLKSGGLTTVKDQKTEYKNWYYDSADKRSKSWSSNTYLRINIEKRDHICSYGYNKLQIFGDYVADAINKCDKGDVLFCANEWSGLSPEHSLFVWGYTNVYEKGKKVGKTVYLYGHTDDKKYEITTKNNKIDKIIINGSDSGSSYFKDNFNAFRVEKTSNPEFK